MRSYQNLQWNKAARTRSLLGMIILGIVFLTGCATIGQDFKVVHVTDIKLKETTQKEIRKMFGAPWRTGREDGDIAWTYGHYYYEVFGERKAKDLVVRFDKKGVVSSYTFSTTEHNE